MRVLVVSPTFLPVVGGAEIFVLEVCSRLARRHEVRLLTPEPPREVVEQQGSDVYDGRVNFDVERFPDRLNLLWSGRKRPGRGLIPPFSISCQGATRRHVSAWKPEVVQAYYVVPCGLAVVAAAKMRVPTVLSYVGREVAGRGMPRAWGFWNEWILRHASAVTFTSDYCRRRVGHPGGEVTYVGVRGMPPASQGDMAAVWADLGLGSGTRVVFSLQRLDAEKRPDVVVRAMADVVRRCGDVAGVVGGKGPDLLALRRLVRELGVEGRVMLPGFLNDRQAAALYRGCELFMFHSTYEPFGLVLADALSCGKPVVSVFNTAIPEVVRNGVDGLLVPVGDWAGMADATVSLLGNDGLRQRMAGSARERARTTFDWASVADRVEAALFRAVAAGPRL